MGKKWMAVMAAAVLAVALGGTALAAGFGGGMGRGCYVDADGDGICDNWDGSGHGCYVDADGDGVCDNGIGAGCHGGGRGHGCRAR